MNINLEMNRFLERRNREAVNEEDESKQIINKIKKAQIGEQVQEIVETQKLNDYNYQRFRRTFNLFVIDINKAINSIGNVIAKAYPTPLDITNSLETISNLAINWNNLVISLSFIGYKKLEKKDKDLINNIINSSKSNIVQLLEDINIPLFDGFSDKQKKILQQIKEQIETNIFEQITL